jgi:hypothetical protein
MILVMELANMPITPTIMIPAIACDTDHDGAPLRASDDSVVPLEVLANARRVAESLYRNQLKANEVFRQLIGTYLAVTDIDVAIIFCPGGWGWSSITRSPGWVSIQNGIREVLKSYGQSAIAIDYKRTDPSLSGVISEFVVLLGISPFKARELAQRIEFLTRHLPGIKILLTGESNGAAMAEDTMRLLRRNPRVYAIQTGPPVWRPSEAFERSLIIAHNGIEPDTFTNGDVPRMVQANVAALFGKYKSAQGNIMLHVGAPGHVYDWDFNVVRQEITSFLAKHFTPK